MKSFKSFIREEVDLAAYVRSGKINIDDEAVRDNINTYLNGVTAKGFINPHSALEKISKALAYFHIMVPNVSYLENNNGVEVFPIQQFGSIVGMNDNGQVVTKNPSVYHLYFEYQMGDDGMYKVFAEVVDEKELSELIDDVEDDMEDAGPKQYRDKRLSEAIDPVTARTVNTAQKMERAVKNAPKQPEYPKPSEYDVTIGEKPTKKNEPGVTPYEAFEKALRNGHHHEAEIHSHSILTHELSKLPHRISDDPFDVNKPATVSHQKEVRTIMQSHEARTNSIKLSRERDPNNKPDPPQPAPESEHIVNFKNAVENGKKDEALKYALKRYRESMLKNGVKEAQKEYSEHLKIIREMSPSLLRRLGILKESLNEQLSTRPNPHDILSQIGNAYKQLQTGQITHAEFMDKYKNLHKMLNPQTA